MLRHTAQNPSYAGDMACFDLSLPGRPDLLTARGELDGKLLTRRIPGQVVAAAAAAYRASHIVGYVTPEGFRLAVGNSVACARTAEEMGRPRAIHLYTRGDSLRLLTVGEKSVRFYTTHPRNFACEEQRTRRLRAENITLGLAWLGGREVVLAEPKTKAPPHTIVHGILKADRLSPLLFERKFIGIISAMAVWEGRGKQLAFGYDDGTVEIYALGPDVDIADRPRLRCRLHTESPCPITTLRFADAHRLLAANQRGFVEEIVFSNAGRPEASTCSSHNARLRGPVRALDIEAGQIVAYSSLIHAYKPAHRTQGEEP